VPVWELRDDAHRIERTFRFRNFREALTFVQGVGELAETIPFTVRRGQGPRE
jgi:4a-hydroxytetrahydrobiopterin dehydratase